MPNAKYESHVARERAPHRQWIPGVTVTREQGDLAIAAGHRAAERKAEALDGVIRAVDWPAVWQAEWGGSLPFDEALDLRATETLLAVMNHAAAERWQEILEEHRIAESSDEEEVDLEVEAVRLFERVRDTLPRGLTAVRSGERVYLIDEGGMERTISSTEQAFNVVDEWKQTRSL
jgi:hypothetical protein